MNGVGFKFGMATKFVIEEYDKAQQEKEEAERKKKEEEDEVDDEEMY